MSNIPRSHSHEEDVENDRELDCESGSETVYRRDAGLSTAGDVATVQQHSRSSCEFNPREGPPGFESETSGESFVWPWEGADDLKREIPIGGPSGYGHTSSSSTRFCCEDRASIFSAGGEHSASKQIGPAGLIGASYDFQSHEPAPLYFAPLGSATATEGPAFSDPGAPCVITLPSTFRLERTNFVVTALCAGQALSVQSLLKALRSALSEAAVDVLNFKPSHCVLECSFHVGNRFFSIFVRVYLAPDRASGQLLDIGNGDVFGDENEETPYVVEAQLREGDRLHFSGLFREIMRAFKNQEDVSLAGTFRYKSRPHPEKGEGLALEEANLAPSRDSIRLPAAERVEASKSTGDNPTESAAMGRAGWDVSPPPVPAGMLKTPSHAELDSDMLEDVALMAKMLRGDYVDVQADAAMTVAGLTADPELREQLSRDGASKAASELSSAAARLLVETRHRPARRQAAVVVANLSTIPMLRAALLASDPPAAAPGDSIRAGGRASYMESPASPEPLARQRRLVESLVVLSMGITPAGATKKKEEEIGMRRECMRALVGLAESQPVRDTPAIDLLLSTEPCGKGADDAILRKRLHECRMILRNHA